MTTPPAYKGGEGMTDEQYYALCVEEEDGSTEIAFFELRREALQGDSQRWESPYTPPQTASCSAGTCDKKTTTSS